jgi:hypothetical protein
MMEVNNTTCGVFCGSWECLLLIGLFQFIIYARLVLNTSSLRDISVGKSDVCLNLVTKLRWIKNCPVLILVKFICKAAFIWPLAEMFLLGKKY